MNFSGSIQGKTLDIVIRGDLIGEDFGPELVELANNAIRKKVLFCLVDISDTKYINSSGIGVLITLLTKFKNQGGNLFLINPSDHVQKLLQITKLKSIFEVELSKEVALKRI
ncbi:MAG: STAS domain-containing protein [Bacteroidota bacterium]